MRDHLDELADQLSLSLLGSPFVGSSTAPETNIIYFLVDMFDDWANGLYELPELQEAFEAHVPNFDLILFIVKLQERGILAP